MIAPEGAEIDIESYSGDWWPVSGRNQWARNVALADEDSGFEFDAMYDPPVETIYNATAFQVGADFGGIREDKYDFVLACHIKGTSEMPWRQVDSEFRKAFSYKRESKIWVRVEESERHLPVRLGGKPRIKAGYGYDPNGEQHGLILLPLVGAYPRWLGETVTSTFVTTTDTTGGGTELGFVTVSNPLPDDYEIWLQWLFQGAAGVKWTIPDYSWGQEHLYNRPAGADAVRKITMPPTIAGEHVLIDVDPMARNGQANSSLDTQYYERMGGKRFVYPIPGNTPETLVPVSVTGAPIGAGIQVRCPRPWPRPWGLE